MQIKELLVIPTCNRQASQCHQSFAMSPCRFH